MKELKSKKTILLIDDNESFTLCLKHALLPLGFPVFSLRDGEAFPNIPINYNSALDYLLSNLSQQTKRLTLNVNREFILINLLLIDGELEDESHHCMGINLALRIIVKLQQLFPCVILSWQHRNPDNIYQGIYGHIRKPVLIESLIEEMNRIEKTVESIEWQSVVQEISQCCYTDAIDQFQKLKLDHDLQNLRMGLYQLFCYKDLDLSDEDFQKLVARVQGIRKISEVLEKKRLLDQLRDQYSISWQLFDAVLSGLEKFDEFITIFTGVQVSRALKEECIPRFLKEYEYLQESCKQLEAIKLKGGINGR